MYPRNTKPLECSSPLDLLANSRTSLASEASGECGILDFFPLPDGIENFLDQSSAQQDLSEQPEAAAEPNTSELEESSESSQSKFNFDENALPQQSPKLYQHILTPKTWDTFSDKSTDPLKSPNLSRQIPQRRVRMYGHVYGKSFSSMDTSERHPKRSDTQQLDLFNSSNFRTEPDLSFRPEQIPFYHRDSNRELSRPQICRTHSISRSWDANNERLNYFPPTLGFKSLISAEEHVKEGSLALSLGNAVVAGQHWAAAASSPWHNAIAKLLLVVGQTQRWFSHQFRVPPNFLSESNLPSPEELQRLTAPIMSRLILGLIDYASDLKVKQFDVEALAIYKLASDLNVLKSITHMYHEGGQVSKRDVAMAEILYKKAGYN